MRYERIKRYLADFMKSQYGTQDVALEELNYSFIQNFDRYLRYEKDAQNNTVVKNIRFVRKVIGFAIKHGWLERDPFQAYDGKMVHKDREFLEDDELDRIKEADFSIERLDRVRDLFLFACYTGLAYVDIKKLTSTDVYKDKEGQYWIKSYRSKTRQRADIFLLPFAIQILKKYEEETRNKDEVLPVPSAQKINAYLKEIADLCRIHKPLTFHIARHTFATTVTLANGVPLETVSAMLGHASVKQTEHYAKMVRSRISNDMKALRSKLQ